MLEKNDPKFTEAQWRKAWFYSDPSIVDPKSPISPRPACRRNDAALDRERSGV